MIHSKVFAFAPGRINDFTNDNSIYSYSIVALGFGVKS